MNDDIEILIYLPVAIALTIACMLIGEWLAMHPHFF